MSMSLCVVAALMIARPVGDEPCIQVTSEYEPCPGCSGYSFCACIYSGAPCPSVRQLCNTRYAAVGGGSYTVVENTTTPCYWVQACGSAFGGLCDPLYNPCITSGATYAVGSMSVYEQSPIVCDDV